MGFSYMAAKVHTSIRLEPDLVKRINALILDGESQGAAMCRLLAAGCDALEGGEHERAQQAPDEAAARVLEILERENARLTAEHEADLRRIDEKDKQLAAALEKAHALTDKAHELAEQAQNLTEQAHVLTGMQSDVRVLPATAATDGKPDEITSDEQPPQTKKSWWREWFSF